jgi:serpin B
MIKILARVSLLLQILISKVSVEATPLLISDSHRVFADALVADMYANENECTSSWGISIAFSLVYPSSTGDSMDQTRSVMGYPTGSQEMLAWDEVASRLDAEYEGQCLGMTFGGERDGECIGQRSVIEIANSVWIDDANALNPSYLEVVEDFNYQIDFEEDRAGGLVNEWVKTSTRDLIDSIVPDGKLTPASLLAINSIYLKAIWRTPFMESATNQDLFYTTAFRDTHLDTEAQFMHIVGYFPYSHDALAGFQIVELSFSDDDLSMIFVLPTSESGGSATSASVLTARLGLERTNVAIALPHFKFKSEYSDALKSSLQSLGLTAPFEGGLCIFGDECTSKISKIIQKTSIDVNENGVEAAAVTAIISVTSAPPTSSSVLFRANHPFQFFIYDANKELVLFEGRVGAPSIPEGVPSAQLQAKHADSDFWQSNFGVDPMDPFPALTAYAEIGKTCTSHQECCGGAVCFQTCIARKYQDVAPTSKTQYIIGPAQNLGLRGRGRGQLP